MKFGEFGATALGIGAVMNPGLLIVAGATWLAGKIVAEKYVDEVRESDRLLRMNFDKQPDERLECAARATADTMAALSLPTCGMSALALGLETRRMRKLRERAMDCPDTITENDQNFESLPTMKGLVDSNLCF